MRCIKRWFFIFLAVFLLTGCGVIPKQLKNFQAIDFVQNGAVASDRAVITAKTSERGLWYPKMKFTNLDTGQTFQSTRFNYGSIAEVPPGEYVMSVYKLSRIPMPQRYYYGPGVSMVNAHIPIEMKSKPFFVGRGELVYIGKISFLIGKPSDMNLADLLTWVGAAVGVSQRNVQVSYHVDDQEKYFLKNLADNPPSSQYQYRKQIMEF